MQYERDKPAGLLHVTFEGYKKSTDYTNGHGGEFISPDSQGFRYLGREKVSRNR